MSNPAKSLKKIIKPLVIIAAVAAVAYIALPAISAAAGGTAAAGSTAAATGSFTAGASTVAAGGGAAAASTAGGGLLSGAAAAAKGIGAAVSGASPMVKLGLIQAGTQFAAGALTPEPQTRAEQLQDELTVYQSQPHQARTYATAPIQPQAATAGQQQSQRMSFTPSAGLLGRYDPQQRRWVQNAE